MSDFADWVGRSEAREDRLDGGALGRLAALLDTDPASFVEGAAPPLSHWLSFLPDAPQSTLDVDGHPRRGSFLPPIELPRRMWAGGRLEFVGELRAGQMLERRSTILSVKAKQGASGPLQFVTVRHEVTADGRLAVVEEQDLVYRGPSSAPGRSEPLPPAKITRRIVPDPMLLFRFSALTFNAHRIHYDRDYAMREEGYAGLVVHGPLQAMLLMHAALDLVPATRIASFSFRSVRPLIDSEAFDLCLDPADDGIALSTRTASGEAAMLAEIGLRAA